jgi:hypothetical protein
MVLLGLGGLLRSAWAAAQVLGTFFRVLFVLVLTFTAGPLANCDLHRFPRARYHHAGQWAWPGVAASAARATLCPAVLTNLGGT